MTTGSLQIKNNTYYAVLNYYENGKRKQKWRSLKLPVKGNKRKAEEQLAIMIAECKNNTCVPDTKMLFSDWLMSWLEIKKGEIQPSTYDRYKSMISAHIFPYFAQKNIKLCKLTEYDIEMYYAEKLNSGLSSNTVHKHHEVIHCCLKYAVKKRILPESVCENVTPPKKQKTDITYIKPEEFNDKIIPLVKGSPIEVPVYLAIWFGLRRSEVLGLTWDSIDFNSKTLSIQTKLIGVKNGENYSYELSNSLKTTASYRTFKIPDEILDYFTELKQRQERNKKICGNCYKQEYSNYVCVNQIGDLIKPDFVTHKFAEITKKAGLKNVTFHSLRHSCASWLLEANHNMKYIQSYLGHSNYQMTADTYSHINPQHKIEMTEDILNKLKP